MVLWTLFCGNPEGNLAFVVLVTVRDAEGGIVAHLPVCKRIWFVRAFLSKRGVDSLFCSVHLWDLCDVLRGSVRYTFRLVSWIDILIRFK